MRRYDFLIIGAGIAGASAAYELAALGRVLILEREPFPGYHATGRSAALYTEPYGNRTVRTLTRASHDFFVRPPADFTDQALLAPRQALYVAREDQLERLHDRAQQEHRDGYVLCPLPARACLERVPILRPGYVAGGLLEPNAMDIDVHALHQGFLRGAVSRGAELIKDVEVAAIERVSQGYRMRAGTQQFEATVVVNAAGAWADSIAQLAGITPIGLQPLRRTAMILDLPDGLDATHWPFVVDVDHEFYFKPEAGKLLASPGNETPSPPCDAQPDELDIAVCVDRMEQATDLAIGRVGRRWAGLRTFAADRSPVVGFDPAADGFFWLVGQGGYGVQTSPAMAKLTARLVRRLSCPPELGQLGFTLDAVSPRRESLRRR